MNMRPTIADFFAQLVRSPDDETGSGETPPAGEGEEGSGPGSLLEDPPKGEDGSPKSLLEGDGEGEGEGEGEGAAPPPPELSKETVLEALKADGLELDEATAEQAEDFFKLLAEEKDPNKIAEQSLRMLSDVQRQWTEGISKTWNDTQTEWQKAAREDPEYGGANFDTSLAKAKEVATKYGGQEFLSLLSLTGAGNHPQMVAFLNKVAKDLPSEGTPTTGTPTAGGEKSLADKLFGGS
jgi:hypothetical protein